MRGLPVLARLLLAGAIATIGVVAGAAPASAHGVGGVQPTNYQTRITSVSPERPGISIRTVDVGDRLEIENRTDHDVVVLGYDGEPYLRVGPRGAFENVRSPSTYINRSRTATGKIPERADSDAAPEWRKIRDEPIVRWHDHRAHWMGGNDPRAVRDAPGETHVVQRFSVEVRDQGTTITARGDVRWVPGPSPWPWLALAAVAAVALVLLSRTRFAKAAIAVSLSVVAVAGLVHVVGAWEATVLGVGTRIGASIYAVGAVVVAVVALVWLLRRGLHAAAPLLLVSGLFVAIASGLADFTELNRSQIPTTLPDDLARVGVALSLGLGIGLAVIGGLRLRGSPEERRRRYLARHGTRRPPATTTPATSDAEALSH